MYTTRVAGVAALFFVAGALAVLAHAKMTASVPLDGETVPVGLSEIQLTFSKPLRPTLVRVWRAKDHQEMPMSGELPKSFVDTATIAVDALPAGSYEVSWTAVSADGHVMKGAFSFSVGEAHSAQPAQ